MTELALHILDIVQNSIVAKATVIEISMMEDTEKDLLTIEIADNGKGMSEDEVRMASDPYFTSRTTRKVGMGLPLFKQAVELCAGTFTIESKPGIGTNVKASMQYTHIDRQPIGDIDFIYKHITNSGEYILDTIAIKNELENISLTNPKVIKFIREMIQENLKEITN